MVLISALWAILENYDEILPKGTKEMSQSWRPFIALLKGPGFSSQSQQNDSKPPFVTPVPELQHSLLAPKGTVHLWCS